MTQIPAWPATTFNYDLARRVMDMLNGLEPLTTNDDLRHLESTPEFERFLALVEDALNTIEELRPRLHQLTPEQLEDIRRLDVPSGWDFDAAWQRFNERFVDARRDGSWHEMIALREHYDELEMIVDSFRAFIPENLWPTSKVNGLVDVGEWRKALMQVIENTANADIRQMLEHVLEQFDTTAYRVFDQAHDAADARMLGPLPPLPPSVDAAALEATLNSGLQDAQARFAQLSALGDPSELDAEQLAEYYRLQALMELYEGAIENVRQGLDPTEYLKQEVAGVEDLARRGELAWANQAEDFRTALDAILGQLRQHGIAGAVSLPTPSGIGVVADGSPVRHVNAAEGAGSWSDTVTTIARRGGTGGYDSADAFDVVDLDAAAVARFTGDSATATLTPAQRAEDFAGLTDASGPYSHIIDVDADDIHHAPTDVQGDNVRVADGQYSVLDDPEVGRGGYSEPDAPTTTAPTPPPPNKVPTVNARPRLSPDNYSAIEDMINASDDPYTTVEDVVSGRAYDSAADNYTAPAATVGVNASGDAVQVQRVPDPPAAQLSGEQRRLLEFYEPAPAPGYDFEFVTYRRKIKGETAPPPGVRWITPNFQNGIAYKKPDGVYGDIEFRTIGLVEQQVTYRDPMSNKAILAADPGRATQVGKGSIHDGAPDVIKRTTPDGWDEFGRPVFELDKGETWRLDHGALTFEFLDPMTMQKLDPSQIVVKPYAGDTADALEEIKRGLMEDAAIGERYRDMMQSRYDAYTDWHRQATKNATKGSSNIDTRPPMPTPELMGGFAPTHPGEWVQLDPADEFLSYLQWQGPMKADGKFY